MQRATQTPYNVSSHSHGPTRSPGDRGPPAVELAFHTANWGEVSIGGGVRGKATAVATEINCVRSQPG